ncbi:MAG: hypothetical protein IK115_04695 [Lachnospiraceae bacterium]|nr:hypothetical protein [Lachnospiraceae bacterium]
MEDRKKLPVFLISIPVYLVLAVVTVLLIKNSGIYPAGADTMCHVYKGDVLYEALGRGELYPLYDPLWYNGVEMLRYWAPFPVYVLAFCQLLGGGDPIQGYLIFVGAVFFFGAVVFSWLGLQMRRPFIGAFFGILWFFLPNNVYALFREGNLPRSLSMIFLPLFLYHVEQYLHEGQRYRLALTSVLFLLIAMCHSGYAGMLALSMLLFLFLYGVMNRCFARCGFLLLSILSGYVLLGIWLLPSLIGGITSTDSSEVMASFFQSAFISLDPSRWFREGPIEFYFGLAAFLTALFGLLCAKRRSQPAFATALLIFFGTTASAYPLLKILPGSQYLWMLRFISIALCMILYGLLAWSSLKPPLQIAVVLLLCADCIAGFSSLVLGDGSGREPEERYAVAEEETLMDIAKEETTQRLALMELSTLGADGAYLLSGHGKQLAGSFGAGWQSATTAVNITQLNRALENAQYAYLFDRALEMGNDSVLIRLSCVPMSFDRYEAMDEDAERSGYHLIAENDDWRLYHAKLPECFGVVSHYDSIGIGSGAGIISLSFPAVEETTDPDLSHYSFEELSSYRSVYLSGFEMSDRAAAEALVKKLADAGVRVIVLADGMPEDPSLRRKSFLGVDCNSIRFRNGYPEMEVHGEILNTDLFAAGFSNWDTVYLTGLKESYGAVMEDGLELDFFGTAYNENIIFLGLNLSYHYALTHDRSAGLIMQECFQMEPAQLPERRIVELDVSGDFRNIVIESPEDGVNTTLATHDSFDADRPVEDRNHLLYVDSGTTRIRVRYPYLWQGALVSLFGVLLFVVTLVAAGKYEENRTE